MITARLTMVYKIFYMFCYSYERSLLLSRTPRPTPLTDLFGGISTWKPGDPTLTVSEIAQILLPIAPDVKATLIRLSHWTLQGMLIPVEQMHAGTGKRRVYAADDVYSAAILHVLTDFGITLSSVRWFWFDVLSKARLALPEWKKKRGALYLKVWRRSTGIGSFGVSAEPPQFRDLKLSSEQESQPAELMLAIDLAVLWGRIEP
jgi:hypothetical protein